MSDFNKDDYLKDLPDVDSLDGEKTSDKAGEASHNDTQQTPAAGAASQPDAAASPKTTADQPAAAEQQDKAAPEANDAEHDKDGSLTPLGQAKKEAAEYLEALQRERAEFINYRNRMNKEREQSRQYGIVDVLTSLLPALDDIDRIHEHGQMDDSFKAVATKIDKTFAKFGVEKFGEKGEDFDPTKHEAVLQKPDPEAKKETVDTVVEAGYRIGDRVVRAARVVVSMPQS